MNEIISVIHIGINAMVYIMLWAIALFVLWHGLRMCFQFPENRKPLKDNMPWHYNAALIVNKVIGAFYLIASLISLCILKGASL